MKAIKKRHKQKSNDSGRPEQGNGNHTKTERTESASNDLHIEMIELRDDAAVINLTGSITSAADKPLNDAWEKSRRAGYRFVILDFARAGIIDGSGVSTLIKLHTRASQTKQELLVASLNAHHKEVFALIGLDRILKSYQSEADSPPIEGIFTHKRSRPDSEDKPPSRQSSTSANWARPDMKLVFEDSPPSAINANLAGLRPVGPLDGFGRLWEEVYELRLEGLEIGPRQVMDTFKRTFPKLHPPHTRCYLTPSGVQPGESMLINASNRGLTIATGNLVSYASDDSFALMTTEGHPQAGWVTLSAYRQNGWIVCQVHSLARANDPLYEIFFRFGGAALIQEHIWSHVLTSLASQLGVEGHVQVEKTKLDPSLQWSQAGQIRHNAQIKTLVYLALTPARRLKRLFKRP